MATRKDQTLRPQLSTLFNIGTIRDRTDGQLLERFATDRDELAELAFAALVERHGAMVMRVCRAQLSNPHDAQDAFQATFLVLVKKSRSLWVEDSLGPWLHQVALRTALCARADAARRQRLERQAAEIAAGSLGQEPGLDVELGRRLHEEIDRLPERYRVPIVLCDLEGHTCEEAARQMGRPVGTVKSWRSRGRQRLRHRLIRAGLAPTGTLESALTADVAQANVTKPEAATIRAAARIQAGRTTPGEVSASVGMLVKGVMRTMLLSKLRMAAAIVCTLTLVGAGLGAVAQVAANDPKDTVDESPNAADARVSLLMPPRTVSAAKEPADALWSLTLRDAIRIGLENAETIRLLKPAKAGDFDEGYEIVPRDTDLDVYQFKAEIMAHVRSIAQQYWSLAQQHVRLRSSEKALEQAEEIRKREESALEVGHGTTADVAEATQRLEQFRLDVMSTTSDVTTTERQLRGILGLPKADGRRIVPASPFKEEKVSPDWNRCVANMLEKQPDVAHAISELKNSNEQGSAKLTSRLETLLLSLRDQRNLISSPETSGVRLSAFLEKYPSLQDVIHQTRHSLGRLFLEVDASYKQFQTASRQRTAATQRLAAQRAFYEEGRITIDRYLDAVSQYANAIAQEAHFKTTYNIALFAIEEAQGTLLEQSKITLASGPKPFKASSARRKRASQSGLPKPQFAVPALPTARIHPADQEDDSRAKDGPQTAGSDAKEFSFQITIPTSPKPVTIRGSFSIAPASGTESSEDR